MRAAAQNYRTKGGRQVETSSPSMRAGSQRTMEARRALTRSSCRSRLEVGIGIDSRNGGLETTRGGE